jgi:hypothetical protein
MKRVLPGSPLVIDREFACTILSDIQFCMDLEVAKFVFLSPNAREALVHSAYGGPL